MIMTYFKQLKGKAALVGLMFLVGGGIYSFTAPLWGYLTDKKVCLKKILKVYRYMRGFLNQFQDVIKNVPVLYFVYCESVHSSFSSDKSECKVLFQGYVKTMISIGNLVAAVGYLLMGPTPLIPDLPL